MESIKLFVAVKACIVNENREVLFLREANIYADGTNISKYDVVGGRIEPGEKLEDALSREVFEESGLKIKNVELLDAYDTFNQKGLETWHIVRLYYIVTCEEGEVILSKDHDHFKWVSIDAIQNSPDIIENLIPIIRKIKK